MEISVGVVIKLIKDQLTGWVNKSKSGLAGLNGEADKTGKALADGMDKGVASSKRLATGMESISTQLGRWEKFAAAFSLVNVLGKGVGQAAELGQLADEFAKISSRLKLAVGDGQAFADVMADVRRISNDTGTELESTATLYQRLAQASKQLGLSQQDVARMTETVNRAFIVSGASSQEMSGAVRQLAQGLASGVLRGDEFNSVMENAPRLAQALADSLGTTTGGLREMAEQGKLTAEVVSNALLGQADAIAAEFEQMPLTIGRAMQSVRNEWLRFVGELDQAKGVSTGVAEALTGLANHIDDLGKVAMTVGEIALAGLAAKTAQAFIATGAAARKAIVDMRGKAAADKEAAVAAQQLAAQEAATAKTIYAGAQARAAATKEALAMAQAEVAAANELAIVGARRAAAERALTVAQRENTAAMAAQAVAARNLAAAHAAGAAAATRAASATGVVGLAMKSIPLPVNIMLAVSAFELLTSAGEALGEGLAKLTPEMRAIEERAKGAKAAMEGQATAAKATAAMLDNYKNVTIQTAEQISRMDVLQREAYKRQLAGAAEYQQALLKQAIAEEALGQKAAVSSSAAGSAIRQLKTAMQELEEASYSGVAAIQAQGEKMVAAFDKAQTAGKSTAESIKAAFDGVDISKTGNLEAMGVALQQLGEQAKLTAEEIAATLGTAIEKLSAQDLLTLRTNAEFAFERGTLSAEQMAAVMDNTLRRAIKDVGSDAAIAADGMTEKFRGASADLEIIAQDFERIKVAGGNAGEALRDAIDAALKAAANPQEFVALEESIKALGAAGKLSKADVVDFLDAVREKADEAMPGINSMAEAFHQLGMKSREELTDAAEKAKEAFDVIRNGGGSTRELAKAFEAYSKAAIAANDGVADATVRAQAEMYQLRIETDSAGNDVVKAMDMAGDGVDRLTDKVDLMAAALKGAAHNAQGLAVNLDGQVLEQRIPYEELQKLASNPFDQNQRIWQVMLDQANAQRAKEDEATRTADRQADQERAAAASESAHKASQSARKAAWDSQRADAMAANKNAPAFTPVTGSGGKTTETVVASASETVHRLEFTVPGMAPVTLTAGSESDVEAVLSVLKRAGARAGRRF